MRLSCDGPGGSWGVLSVGKAMCAVGQALGAEPQGYRVNKAVSAFKAFTATDVGVSRDDGE